MGNINFRTAFLYLIILSFLPNCAPRSLYTWNGYDQTVHDYYENPGEREKFVGKLEETILEAEENGNVPPGLYSEYGYTLYEIGDYVHAAEYFEKEKAAWPESTLFMNKMIRNCKLQDKGTSKSLSEPVEGAGKLP